MKLNELVYQLKKKVDLGLGEEEVYLDNEDSNVHFINHIEENENGSISLIVGKYGPEWGELNPKQYEEQCREDMETRTDLERAQGWPPKQE